MDIIDHGRWTPYTPEVWPKDLPQGVLFARRENDLVDWYEYSRAEGNFRSDSIKFIAHQQDTAGGWVIGAAVRDVSMLFPANAVVAEIVDYDGSDPQRELGQKLFDPKARTIEARPRAAKQRKDPFELVHELETRIDDLQKRIEELERID